MKIEEIIPKVIKTERSRSRDVTWKLYDTDTLYDKDQYYFDGVDFGFYPRQSLVKKTTPKTSLTEEITPRMYSIEGI